MTFGKFVIRRLMFGSGLAFGAIGTAVALDNPTVGGILLVPGILSLTDVSVLGLVGRRLVLDRATDHQRQIADTWYLSADHVARRNTATLAASAVATIGLLIIPDPNVSVGLILAVVILAVAVFGWDGRGAFRAATLAQSPLE